MEGASTVWGNGSGLNPSLDKLAPMMQQQSGAEQNGSNPQDLQGLYGLSSDPLSGLGNSASSDPNSVIRLQQNLQRLYGSLGHLHGSRASLPDIQEEEPHSGSANSAATTLTAPPISTPALQAPQPGRSRSEDDLFRMDAIPGNSNGMQQQQQISDLTLVGQMPSDGAESRTLFVRGVDPVASDEELVQFFECFGDVRALYSAAKQRGMVVISYHDIRAATLAHHTLHGQEVKGRTLTCQFTRPKDLAEAASGSLLVVSLDPAQTKQDVYYALLKYGELRELKEDVSRPNSNCWLAEYFDTRHALAALSGITQSPGAGGRLLVLDAGSVASSQQGQSVAVAAQQLRNASSSPALAGLGGSASQLDAASLLLSGNGNNNGHGGHGAYMPQDLSGMTRSLSEMSLDGSTGGGGLFGSTASMQGGLMGRLPAGSMSTGDLMSTANMNGINGLRGAASTGSLWPQTNASLGSSPLGGQGVWPSGAGGVNSLAALQHEQQAAQQVAYFQQQQQNALVQTAAMQAALQQALLVQQAQQASFVRHPVIGGMPRRGFSEPALGGRLARRPTDPVAEAERRAQQERLYSLDIPKIMAGEDRRTTLMVKNIPNKYTQKMLLSLIEERFRGTFDFFYLPIDFKNRCNVGYAFINMTVPTHIPPLVKEFHGKRWPKFNSEKICNIAYARIQGKTALVQHFQNSSLLHEDKRCRPVLFKSEGDGTGELEAFPLGPAALLNDPPAAGGIGGGIIES